MKRLLTAAATILLMATFANLPVFGQSAEVLNADGKLNRNPVRYSDARAFSDGRGVWLEWKTEIETKNLGFYLYRIISGERELVSPALIPGAYMQAREEKITSGSYSFFDRLGDFNSVYVIESFHTGGQRFDSNLIQTKFVKI